MVIMYYKWFIVGRKRMGGGGGFGKWSVGDDNLC